MKLSVAGSQTIRREASGQLSIRFLCGAAALLALLEMGATLWLFYPGLVTYDSILQFAEAQTGRFTTTHPPLMAAVWRAFLLTFGGGALPMLVMNQLLYWGSFAVLSFACIRSSRRWWGILAVFAGLWPLLLQFSGVIWKDVTLAAAWALSCGFMLVAAQKRGGRIRFWLPWTAATILLLFGTAMRHNGFAGAIILAFALARLLPANRLVSTAMFLCIAGLAIAAVPFSTRLLNASDSHPIQGLISWDLTGISYFSGRNYRQAPGSASAGNLACYTPRLYDNCPPVNFESTADALHRWTVAIANEPRSYLEHRALVFSMLLRFGCKACQPYIWESGAQSLPSGLEFHANPARAMLGHFPAALARTPLGRPYLWLTAAIGLSLLFWKRRNVREWETLALICISGVVYTVGYFVAAVTDEFRYVYWLIYAAILAGTFYLLSGRAAARDLAFFVLAPILLMIAVDTAIQIFSPTDFIAPSIATNY